MSPSSEHRDLASRLTELDPDQRALLAKRLGRSLPDQGPAPAAPARMRFSLFFFSGDGSDTRGDRYDLLFEAAKFGDRHGFEAVWVPERHFVDFGGLFPNPAVIAAALAAVTERIELRAGSVVLPLHHPIRLAEEWSVVDALSGGRAGISIASGWHPNDFVLAPERYEDRRDVTYRQLQTLRRLWSGEKVGFPGPDGSEVAVATMPRPVRAELPVWVTSGGTPETFRRAGEIGANLLASLLGGPLEKLAEGIAAYRSAREQAGLDPQQGVVTVMLHTFLGSDRDAVAEVVREPMYSYLESFMRQGGHQVAEPGEREKEKILAASFERYFDGASLLGTVESVTPVVEDLAAAGVDEVACLLDFGVDPATVAESLPHLDALRGQHAGEGDGER